MSVVRRHVLTWIAVLTLGSSAALVSAQTTPSRQVEPGFGSLTQERAFDAEVDARIFADVDGERCEGFIASRPLLALEIASPIEATLRLRAGYEGSLVVQSPSGVLCTGSPEVGAAISRTWEPGRYSVYVGLSTTSWGSYTGVELFEPGSEPGLADDGLTGGGEGGPLYEVHLEGYGEGALSELDEALVRESGVLGEILGGDPDEVPSGVGMLSTIDYSLDGGLGHGTGELVGEWSAVLSVAEVMSLWGLEACPGAVGALPSHTLEIHSNVGAQALRLYADTPADPVVLIDGPDTFGSGLLRCVTPGEDGLLVDFGSDVGTYQVWVGGQSGESGEYRIRLEIE